MSMFHVHVPCINREQAPLPHKALAMLLGHTLRSRDRGGVRCVAHMLDPLSRADPTSAENARFERLFAENARAASPGGRGSLPTAASVPVPALGAAGASSVVLYRVEAVGEAAGGGGLPRLRVFSARCATKQLSSQVRSPAGRPPFRPPFAVHPPRPPSFDTPPPLPSSPALLSSPTPPKDGPEARAALARHLAGGRCCNPLSRSSSIVTPRSSFGRVAPRAATAVGARTPSLSGSAPPVAATCLGAPCRAVAWSHSRERRRGARARCPANRNRNPNPNPNTNTVH
jgi:hypothetical protein